MMSTIDLMRLTSCAELPAEVVAKLRRRAALRDRLAKAEAELEAAVFSCARRAVVDAAIIERDMWLEACEHGVVGDIERDERGGR